MERIRLFFARLNLRAAYDVGSLDLGHVLIRLTSEEDYQRLWARETWDIDRIPMKIFKWSMDFASHKDSAIVPAWILLPGLPPNFFKQNILFSIVQAIGKPLKMDHATATLARPSVARVCVEVDLMSPNPSRIWVAYGNRDSGFWQKIEYEYLPKYCGDCLRLGHEKSECEGKMMPPTTLQHNYKDQQGQPRDLQRNKNKRDTEVEVSIENHDMMVSQINSKGVKELEKGGAKSIDALEVWIPKNKGGQRNKNNHNPDKKIAESSNYGWISKSGRSTGTNPNPKRSGVLLVNSFDILQSTDNLEFEEPVVVEEAKAVEVSDQQFNTFASMQSLDNENDLISGVKGKLGDDSIANVELPNAKNLLLLPCDESVSVSNLQLILQKENEPAKNLARLVEVDRVVVRDLAKNHTEESPVHHNDTTSTSNFQLVGDSSSIAEKHTEDSLVCVNGKEICPWTGITCNEIDLTSFSSGLKGRGFVTKKPRSTFKRVGRKSLRGEHT